MEPDRADRLRRGLVVVATLAVAWTGVLLVTNGIVWHVAGRVVSTRNPRTPFAVVVLSALAWLALPGRQAAIDASRRTLATAAARGGVWVQPATLVALIFAVVDIALWAGARPLWLDEQMIALNLRDRSAVGLAGTLWLGQSAPYGWLLVQRALLVSFGASELVLRVVALLHGVGLLALAAWIAQRWLRPLAGLVFAGLCALGVWVSHFVLELKHYAGDATWALLLPVMAAWAIDADRPAARTTRLAWWTAAAVVGQWIANGATFVTPACLAVLAVAAWRHQRLPGVMRVATAGLVWGLALAAHYAVALRYSAGSAYLHSYWWPGFPPADAGAWEVVRWWGTRFHTLALNPGGTRHAVALWLAATAGCALAPWPRGVLVAAVPVSGFLLAAFRVAPFVDRQALWIVPALYLGVAFLVDAALQALRAHPRRPAALALAAAAAALVVPLAADVAGTGWEAYRAGRWPDSNHGLDDREGVRWLLAQARPGDVLLTTTLAVPAVWWYGTLPIGGGGAPGGPRILDVDVGGEGCAADAFAAALGDAPRVFVYLGIPPPAAGLSEALVARVSALGRVDADRQIALLGRAVVVTLPPVGSAMRAAAAARARAASPCLLARPAQGW